ncbi:MAG: hypothetical protein N2689_07340 [Verrucomicrobiae bacterium]|nr:hypothetical protein [Verrucomicrobiae bacterium]
MNGVSRKLPSMRYLLSLLLLAVAARAESKTEIEFAMAGGTKDEKVPFEQSLKFQEKMKAAGNVSKATQRG